MRKPRRTIRFQIDGKDFGLIDVSGHATERQKILAACRLPGVLARLRRCGVAASAHSDDKYNILTRPPSEYPKFETLVFADFGREEASGGEKIPFRGLGIPSAYGDGSFL